MNFYRNPLRLIKLDPRNDVPAVFIGIVCGMAFVSVLVLIFARS